MSFRSAVGHGEASGAHNGIALITTQQEPQQCGNEKGNGQSKIA